MGAFHLSCLPHAAPMSLAPGTPPTSWTPLTVGSLPAPWLSLWDGVAQPLYVPFQQCCSGQCLALGIPHYPEGLLPGFLLMILVMTKMFTYSLCLGMVFHCSRHPRGLPWLLWLGGTPPMMDAFSQWVHDLLAGLFCHLWTTWYWSWGPLQLVDLLV